MQISVNCFERSLANSMTHYYTQTRCLFQLKLNLEFSGIESSSVNGSLLISGCVFGCLNNIYSYYHWFGLRPAIVTDKE